MVLQAAFAVRSRLSHARKRAGAGYVPLVAAAALVALVLVMVVAAAGLAVFVGVAVVMAVAAACGLAVLCERAGNKGLRRKRRSCPRHLRIP